MDSDPLRALDRWDGAIAEVDARHFVTGAGCGSQGAFSRTQADHDPETERTLSVSVHGDRATVRTDAPNRFYRNRRTQYVYALTRSSDGWRIAQLVEDEAAAKEHTAESATATPPAAMAPPPAWGAGPDYSSVDVRAAKALVVTGQLTKVLLLPAELGGDEGDPRNVVYAPLFVAEQKQRIDLTIVRPMVAEGKVKRYTASPEYRGTSAIPIALHIRAYDPGEFVADIHIWGPDTR
jgi:hypothetical protein